MDDFIGLLTLFGLFVFFGSLFGFIAFFQRTNMRRELDELRATLYRQAVIIDRLQKAAPAQPAAEPTPAAAKPAEPERPRVATTPPIPTTALCSS